MLEGQQDVIYKTDLNQRKLKNLDILKRTGRQIITMANASIKSIY